MSAAAAGELSEAARLPWRRPASERTLRRRGWLWTAWTTWVASVFALPGVALVAIEPLAFPAAALCVGHAWAIPWLQARRGARSLVALGGRRGAMGTPGESPGVAGGRGAAGAGPEAVALGLLGDLVGHRQRELLAACGVVVERGHLGAWVLGEQGALLIRRGGRRVDCWCVRVAEHEDLPAGDRVAHLLLALREDERGFATVANLGFSGAAWRVRRKLAPRVRPAFEFALAEAKR